MYDYSMSSMTIILWPIADADYKFCNVLLVHYFW